jgi:NADH-quinone oxidoreductase subunit M
MALGIAGILYGAVLAFAQSDFKRLVAYTSVAHLGFVLLGVFAGTAKALQGAVFQMIAHGLSTGALFIVAGLLQARLGHRDMDRMGGLWAAMPRLGGLTMVFAIAALGLPGLGNFVGEFLVLWGTLERSIAFAAVAAVGLVFAVIYALALVQRPFHGAETGGPQRDLSPAGTIGLAAMALGIVWLGLFPQTVLATAAPALDALQRAAAETLSAGLAR